MKKAIFLLLAVVGTSFAIYSCQKDLPNTLTPVIDESTAASNRADYATCEECYENCTDCCLLLQNTGTINTTFGFVNPATGLSTSRVLAAGTSKVVCAAGGWLAIFGGTNATGTITVCSSGQVKVKGVGPNYQGTLTWDCIIN